MSNSSDESLWLGRGTWLVDRRDHGPDIGVIAKVDRPDDGFGARVAIHWRSNRYQNCSVSVALENFKRGVWEVDDAS